MNDTDLLIKIATDHGVNLRSVSGKLLGLCPIHSEKTPSFWIYEDKGKFHCYGCNAGGDAIDLHRALTGAGYIEAKKALGLWDETRPAPRARTERMPREFTSNDRRKCWVYARASLVKLRDMTIIYRGRKYLNHQFIISTVLKNPDPLKYLNPILRDMQIKNQDNGWESLHASFFINDILKRFDNLSEVDG